MMQTSFGALWDFAFQIRNNEMTIKAASEACKKLAAAEAGRWRRLGCKVRRWSMPNQVRPYWGLGKPCGLSCTVYMLDIYREER